MENKKYDADQLINKFLHFAHELEKEELYLREIKLHLQEVQQVIKYSLKVVSVDLIINTRPTQEQLDIIKNEYPEEFQAIDEYSKKVTLNIFKNFPSIKFKDIMLPDVDNP